MKPILFLSLLLFLGIAGCDLFSTRQAEAPNQVNNNFQYPLTTGDLLINLKNAIHDGNAQNYLACLSDSLFTDKKFSFVPSSSAALQFPALSQNWGRSDEEQYFNNIKTYQMNLILTNENSSPQGDSLIYSASYSLTVLFDQTSIPQNYEGELRFDMVRDSRGVWVIYYWQDSKKGDLPSWSELKGRFH